MHAQTASHFLSLPLSENVGGGRLPTQDVVMEHSGPLPRAPQDRPAGRGGPREGGGGGSLGRGAHRSRERTTKLPTQKGGGGGGGFTWQGRTQMQRAHNKIANPRPANKQHACRIGCRCIMQAKKPVSTSGAWQEERTAPSYQRTSPRRSRSNRGAEGAQGLSSLGSACKRAYQKLRLASCCSTNMDRMTSLTNFK